MIFKKEFVEKLKLKIPENIKKFNLIYPEKQNGYVRFDKFKLNAVYLEDLTDEHNNEILLKFKYRDFHYVPPNYIFDSIYVMSDGCNEYRYDKNLELIAKYLRDISIKSELDLKTKLHILNILIEWKNFNEKFKKEYICAYQIEKNKKKVKVSYAVFNDKLENNSSFEILNSMLEKFDVNNIDYFQKCKVINNKIIKEDIIYLGNKINTNYDG